MLEGRWEYFLAISTTEPGHQGTDLDGLGRMTLDVVPIDHIFPNAEIFSHLYLSWQMGINYVK